MFLSSDVAGGPGVAVQKVKADFLQIMESTVLQLLEGDSK